MLGEDELHGGIEGPEMDAIVTERSERREPELLEDPAEGRLAPGPGASASRKASGRSLSVVSNNSTRRPRRSASAAAVTPPRSSPRTAR